jgi:hypothetical protein
MNNRVKLSTIVKNQLPEFIRVNYPLLGEFLTSYYKSQEYTGSPIDLLTNIDNYLKLDELTKAYNPSSYDQNFDNKKNIVKETILTGTIEENTTTINVQSTNGFPDTYGLIKIDDEIITYERKNKNQFLGCIRGLSAIESWKLNGEFIFSETIAESHLADSTVINISVRFLDIFLNKVKKQLIPGFDPDFSEEIDQNIFIKHAKDFYKSKGTDSSFKILFKALYGEDVKIIKPGDYLIKPSNSFNKITRNIVVEPIEGDPLDLVNRTLRQEAFLGQDDLHPNYNINESYGTVSYVEKIYVDSQEYYNISLDFGYSRDIPVDGTIFGNFVSHPKTKLISPITTNPSTIDVDSTLGFPDSGRLVIEGLKFDYNGKSSNQFYDVNLLGNLDFNLLENSSAYLDVYAYGETQENLKDIKVRITPVINKLKILEDTYYMNTKDTAKIKSLGFISEDKKANTWIFNHAIKYNAVPVISGNILSTIDENNFRVGDIIKIVDQRGIESEKTIISIDSNKIFTISPPILNDGIQKYYTIYRKLLKNNASSSYPNLENYLTNVQNTYVKSYNDDILVSSNSIPYFSNKTLSANRKKIQFSGIFGNPASLIGTFDLIITNNTIDHGFFTGDSVYYSQDTSDIPFNLKVESTGLDLLNGVYFVKRIDRNTIRLANSLSDLYREKWISLYADIPESNKNTLDYYPFYGKSLKPQNILREISSFNEETVGNYETTPGATGIFINGVELLNYKSTDTIYYGGITNIKVTSPGQNYDVINPPITNIIDDVGTGCSCIPSVNGSLKRINILDPGYDYLDDPIIQIRGGNGSGAKVKPKMKIVPQISYFNSRLGVRTDNNTIGFATYHKFKNGEKIIYKTDGLLSISGLATDSEYYVSLVDYNTVKLHLTNVDAISGINTINLISVGSGIQRLESYNGKRVISELFVENSGINYQNKKRLLNQTGINTFSNTFNIVEHGYNDKEIIVYNTTGTEIGGLTNNSSYIVTKINDNSFKLSEIGLGVTFSNYEEKKYVEINQFGSGIHSFNYEPIEVSIIGSSSLSPVPNVSFDAKIQPIFRGSIDSIHITSSGVSYGSTEILNYKRSPVLEFTSGKDAKLIAIVNDEKIKEVLILNSGKDYISPPDLLIEGSGNFAKLTPIIQDGKLVEVKVLDGGIGYKSSDTRITVISAGSGCKVETSIQEWTVNLVRKNYSSITQNGDDGFITNSINPDYELQYVNLYTPRVLRESVYSNNSEGEILYGITDLEKNSNNIEISSTNHSPIIGWAYDGNPIYGPYGYENEDGTGNITQMISGYDIVSKSNRPPGFELGFFVEDYEYVRTDTTLDESNGRFCVTPDFPNGVYAYFTTLSSDLPSSSGPFRNYKIPEFPYVIGNFYKSLPNNFNFDKNSNQNNYNLNNSDWFRNTEPYNLKFTNSGYDYIFNPNDIQVCNTDVTYSTKGKIDSLNILSGGNNYKIDDTILLSDPENSGKYGAICKVDKISGKNVGYITSFESSFDNVELSPTNQFRYIGIVSTRHNLITNNLITLTGFSTSLKTLEKTFKIEVPNNKLTLTSNIPSSSVTGLVTYFSVNGNLNYPNIIENDILGIGTEKVKVLNIYKNSSKIRVLREFDNTVGSSHSLSDSLVELSRKFYFNHDVDTYHNYKINKDYYIIPSESVGIGTTYGIGIGHTITFTNTGVGITQVFIPTKSIYIEKHGLSSGDELIYNYENGTPIGVSNNGISSTLLDNQILYVLKISNNLIGLCTSFNNISVNNSLFFTDFGSGDIHKFKTNYKNLVTCKLHKNTSRVFLDSNTHNLKVEDKVFMNVKPTNEKIINIQYNDALRRLIVNPIGFTTADVNITENTIYLENHGYEDGEIIIHSSSSPCNGLENDKIYYIKVKDRDTVYLYDNYYNLIENKKEVDINSQSFGSISQVNPKINVIKNQTIKFDLSHLSLSNNYSFSKYSSFDFNIYKDSFFRNIFKSSKTNKNFEVEKFGQIGISSDAYLKLFISDNVPDVLYYNLKPSNDKFVSQIKKQIFTDNEAANHNKIVIVQSKYSGEKEIIGIGTSYFDYDLNGTPEENQYSQLNSFISYTTDSKNEFGSIVSIKVNNSSDKYDRLPGITTVITNNGENAILEPSSKSLGKILSTRVSNIGFDYPTDNTLRPFTVLPNTLKVLPLSSFDKIFVTSPGRDYTQSPELLVIDAFTKQIVSDVILDYKIGSPEVTILKNSSGFYDIDPIIIPINNTNGVGISSIYFDNSNKDVTVFLGKSFSTGYFPFNVGDHVLIENTSIIGGGIGYNSKNYNYELFEITDINPFFGGSGNAYVKFNLKNHLTPLQTPGIFNNLNTFGKIINEKDFPKFRSTLVKNNFIIGETVESSNKIGIVEQWNSNTEFLKITTDKIFDSGDIVIGRTSKTRGFIEKVFNFNCEYELAAYSDVNYGTLDESGFLNNNIQRLSNNYYYQNFSYSLNSKVNIEDWSESIDNLNHTVGFLKFSDYIVESIAQENALGKEKNNLIIQPSDSSLIVVNDIINVVDLEDVPYFDIVTENKLIINNSIFSNEIIFKTRELLDYFESTGNRVLTIDDISKDFNSDPRPTPFSAIDSFDLDFIAKKYFVHIKDKTFFDERQFTIVTLLNDNLNGFINQYSTVSTTQDLGYFDFRIFGSNGQLIFYPIKYKVNDYDLNIVSYDMKKNLTSIGNTYSLGNIVDITTHKKTGISSPTTIVGISSNDARSLKLLVFLSDQNNNNQFDEISLIHDDNDVYSIEYGKLVDSNSTSFVQSGFGTYHAYLSNNNLNLDFYPNNGIIVNTNVISVGIANSQSVVDGITYLNDGSLLGSSFTNIPSSGSSYDSIIASYPDTYESCYFIVCVTDLTNNHYQISEVAIVNDSQNDPLISEYGILTTHDSLGEISARRFLSNIELIFTQKPNADIQVRVFRNAFKIIELSNSPNINSIDFVDSRINISDKSSYSGTESSVRTSFNLQHNQKDIFRRNFSGIDTSVIDIDNSSLIFPDHYFVTGERVRYIHLESTSSPIGIATTSIPGIGNTNYLPEDLYVVKVNDNTIQLSSSAEDSLRAIPETLKFTSVGIGSLHYISSYSPNSRVLITLDNLIQSPVAGTAYTTILVDDLKITENRVVTSGLTSFFSSDLIKIEDEIMKIDTVGFGSENTLLVRRPWLGTVSVAHSAGATIQKLSGSYNIVDNILYFADAPRGMVPSIYSNQINPIFNFNYDSTTGLTTVVTVNNHSYVTGDQIIIGGSLPDSYNGYYEVKFSDNINLFTINLPSGIVGIASGNLYTYKPNKGASVNDRDWIGISTSTRFHGRSFMKSGLLNTSNDTYSNNYIFDDISHDFDSIRKSFTLTSSNQNVVGFSTYNSIILIDNIFQSPQGTLNTPQNYEILENAGVSTITFVGTATSSSYDPNNASLPIGGVIVSVGSTQGFGYQPLVSAGGTAIVSSGGTIQSISIGNSGSGYRSGVQTNVYVSVATTDINNGISTSVIVGIASISDGNIISIQITNPGSGYTSSNPPRVSIDAPLPYYNIPLTYSTLSSGNGVQATVDIIVSQDSSVSDFNIRYSGYSYEIGDILTVPTGGPLGIPKDNLKPFEEFKIYVDKTYNYSFNGWSFGQLLALDDIDHLFDGQRTKFPLLLDGNLLAIKSKRGSNIDVKTTLLVFVNDVLQVPGEGYTFNGGTIITFTEPLKGDVNGISGTGDKCKILFYRGSGDIDVRFKDVLETVKRGDELQILRNKETCNNSTDQFDRTVYEVQSVDLVETNLYNSTGINDDLNCLRPVVWKRQRNDLIINGDLVGKDRIIFEPIINPISYCIQPISAASTQIYVENVKTFFDSSREDLDPDLLKNIIVTSQDEIEVGFITAHISSGVVTNCTILNSGSGYVNPPKIYFESPIGISNTYRAVGITSIISGSISDVIIINPGLGYTLPPNILVESPTVTQEEISVTSYDGDFGYIVGIQTANPVGLAQTVIDFDLFIPPDSFLKDESIMGVGLSKTFSSLKVNDYFVVKNTVIGNSAISLRSDNSIIGIGTTFLDNVYQVIGISTIIKSIPGYGNTFASRVSVSVLDYNGVSGVANTSILGEYTWGLITLGSRLLPKQFNSYLNNGITGLSTSAIVKRKSKLKFKDYLP